MASRIAEIVVILLLRLAFVIPNKRRDKKFAEGNAEYDPNVTTYEDMTDLENKHFRYLCELSIPTNEIIELTAQRKM